MRLLPTLAASALLLPLAAHAADPYSYAQPDQVKVRTTAHERAQKAGAMQGEPLPGTEPPLPEGLRRTPKGGLGPHNGRRQD